MSKGAFVENDHLFHSLTIEICQVQLFDYVKGKSRIVQSIQVAQT